MACVYSSSRRALLNIERHYKTFIARCYRPIVTAALHSQASGRQAKSTHRLMRVCSQTSVRFRHDEKIVASPFTCGELPHDVTFHDYLTSRFDEFGDAVAVIDGQTGHHYTFNQVRETAKRLGSALVRLGFKPGDVLCLYSHNVPEYGIVFLAVSGIGGVVSAANPLYTVDELSFQIENTGAKFLVTVPTSAHTAQMVQRKCSTLQELIVIGEQVPGFHSFDNLVRDDGACYPTSPEINPKNDLLALPYSSGTTGLPKGVMLTHYNVVSNLVQSSDYPFGLGAIHGKDVYLAVLPFFHIYAQVAILFLGLQQGVKIVTLSKFEPEVFLDCIQEHKVSVLHLVPPIVLLMAKHPMISKYDLSSVHGALSAAAPCGNKLAKEFKQNTGIKYFRQGYGLTETSPITHLAKWDTEDVGSIGYPLPRTECKVVDIETGEDLGPNQEGELLIRGPQVMKGYWNNEEATSRTIDQNGWFHSGDISCYTEEGLFYITDRLKELIKYKGFQVAPAELEHLLLSHPCVYDCAVIGVPDVEAGELPRAYVVLKPNSESSEVDILEYVNAKVAPSKKLRGGVRFIDAIPKTASGKILRRVLKDAAVANKS